MATLIDARLSYVTWGSKAKFHRGLVGLVRDDSDVYLAFVCGSTKRKVPALPEHIVMMPAAIRFKSVQKDLFIKDTTDKLRLDNMTRSLRLILRRDELVKAGKGPKLARLIADLPHLDEVDLKPKAPLQTHFTFVGNHFSGLDKNQDIRRMDLSSDGDMVVIDDDVKMCFENDAQELERRLRVPARQQLKYMKTIGVRDLPENLYLADSLNRLALIECNLVHVPKQLETLSRSLHYLDLSRNNINKLPRTFCCKMNNLRYLNLSNNSIETLPLEIKFFSRLVDLDISNNHLRLLPTTFSDLRSLKTLNVANNKLSQLPAFRKEDIRLEVLDISSNPLDGALNSISTFEVFSSYEDGSLGYQETAFSNSTSPYLSNIMKHQKQNRVPRLFEIVLLTVVRNDFLFKLASEESLPKTIVSTMQRDVFKCYRCNEMNMLPAYNSTDFLDYVEQVNQLITSANYRTGMTFMKLLCRDCFGHMNS